MNQEEEGTDAIELINLAEIECEDENEEVISISTLDEEDSCHKTDEYFDEEYRKMEKEDAMIFKNESWLEHCQQMEVDNNQTPDRVEIQQKLEVQEDEDDDIEVIYSSSKEKSKSTKTKGTKIVLQSRWHEALESTHDKDKIQNEKVLTPSKNHGKNTRKRQEETLSILDEATVSETETAGLGV